MSRDRRNRRCGCVNNGAETILETDFRRCNGGLFSEDIPMRRHTNPIAVSELCACDDSVEADGTDLAAIAEALREQNRLLSELACAVSGLTGVALSCRRER